MAAKNGPGAAGGPTYNGSYFERMFLDPLADSAMSIGGGTLKGLWRGLKHENPWRLSDYSSLIDDLRPDRGDWGFLTNVAGAPTRLLGRGVGTVAQGVAGAVGATARSMVTSSAGMIPSLASASAALPGMALGAAAQGVSIAANVAEKGYRAANWVWNSRAFMKDTAHWSGEFGMKQWTIGAELGIVGAGAIGGLLKGGHGAFNTHRLGFVDAGQLSGTLTEARSQGRVEEGASDPAWYDADADGNLVFALNKLRNRR